MPYKNLVKELKALDQDQRVKLILTPGKKGLIEECTVSTEYEGYGVSFVAAICWRFSTLKSDDMTLGEVVDVLKKKKLDKITNKDLYGCYNEESSDGGTDFENVKWDEGTPEEVQEAADLWDLYSTGNIDCECVFRGLESFEIELEDFSSYVVNAETT